MATHVVAQPYGLEDHLCAACAEVRREAYRKAKSKGCGPQPEVEEYDHGVEVRIAIEALGLPNGSDEQKP